MLSLEGLSFCQDCFLLLDDLVVVKYIKYSNKIGLRVICIRKLAFSGTTSNCRKEGCFLKILPGSSPVRLIVTIRNMAAGNSYSIVEYFGGDDGYRCGYCKNEKGNFSHGK